MMQFSGIPFIDWLVWTVVHADVNSVVSGRDCTDHASIVDVVFIGYKAFERGWFNKISNMKLMPFWFLFLFFLRTKTSQHIPTLITASCVECV